MLQPRALCFLLLLLVGVSFGCGPSDEAPAPATPSAQAPPTEELALPVPRTIEKPSGLVVTITQNGAGKALKLGMRLSVHYRGTLAADGREFDSSYARGTPLRFTLGVDPVIAGWVEGLRELRVGDRARFDVPAKLAYGSTGNGAAVPPDADLVFEVEVVDAR